MSETNFAVRLKLFMQSKDISITQFADQCGIPRPTLSQLLNGRNKKLSDLIVKLIHGRFPELSVLWLMFGEGEMLVPAPINPALVSEAEKFLDDFPDDESGENLSELNQHILTSKYPENQGIRLNVQRDQSKTKIDSEPQIPRKVRSITVFYDDNSYETFIPEKK